MKSIPNRFKKLVAYFHQADIHNSKLDIKMYAKTMEDINEECISLDNQYKALENPWKSPSMDLPKDYSETVLIQIKKGNFIAAKLIDTDKIGIRMFYDCRKKEHIPLYNVIKWMYIPK